MINFFHLHLSFFLNFYNSSIMKSVRTFRTARTPRTARTGPEIYMDLNNPVRNKTRTPLAPAPPAYTPRPRVHTQRQFTDTTSFRAVDEKTHSVESVINSGRKSKAAQVQAWIDEFNPSPIEVLRKIAQVSQPHQHLLNLICDELEKYPPEKLKDPIHELNDDAFDQITGIKIRSQDLEGETEELRIEEEELKRKLKEAEDNLAKTKDEYDRYKRLVSMSTFTSYEKEQEALKTNHQVELLTTKPVNTNDSKRYNSIWGENNHLRDETKKLQKKIDQERSKHHEYTQRKAMKIAEKRNVPLVESTTDEEFLKMNTVTPM
ncbi:hypothetical protein TRFO_01314 [Tritrichomonas foetus]|uniref:Uncharacterized protein n=1 Tax=Tritrichomonas foetus TaxID=1144522 RepID=A0A1J4KBW0_9EUKA|nr:hypothetical protein TRFO_01314 [Tritrichomonas foetus]|eukprot:OHT07180.1 hypothetical protein TRFO_01314 [Tritrichomonas foetus]